MSTLGRTRAIVIALATLAALLIPRAASSEHQPPIAWRKGPVTADLGDFAQVDVPEGFLVTDKKGAQKLLELTHNLVGGGEVGAMVPAGSGPEDNWFVVFDFADVGYVKDEDKDKIDAAALLKTIREGTEQANKERRRRGWNTFTVDGWERAPYYDSATHNLTWSIRGISDSGSVSVNRSVRILGRRGTMNVDLVLDPAQVEQAVPRFDAVMGTYRFKEGHRYADFTKGDKVAAFGLTALVVGGAGAAVLKGGLLAKLFAVLLGLKKLLVVAVLGIVAFFKRLFAKVRGRVTPADETVALPPDDKGNSQGNKAA